MDKTSQMGSLLRSAEGDSRRLETAEKAVAESFWDRKDDDVKAMVLANLERLRKKSKGIFGFRAPAKALAEERIVVITTIKKIDGRLEDEDFLVVGDGVLRGYFDVSNIESIMWWLSGILTRVLPQLQRHELSLVPLKSKCGKKK